MKRLLIASIFLLYSFACSAEDLVIVSPHWEGIRYEFARAFSADYEHRTGKTVNITWLDVGGTSEIIRYLQSQYQSHPQSAGIDLLFGGGVDPFIALKQASLLAPLNLSASDLTGIASTVAGIPLQDPDGYFMAPTMSAFGIICNRAVLKRLNLPEPRTWEDLAKPEFKSWIGSADPRSSGSMHMAYEIILQAYGWEKGWNIIYHLASNVRAFVANSLQVSKDVANGETACGLAIDTQAASQIQAYGTERISFIIPEGLSVINGDSIALLKGAPHAELARDFVRFLFSEAGQKIWYYKQGALGGPLQYELSRLSVMPKLYENTAPTLVTIDPFALHSTLAYDFTLGSKRWSLVSDLLQMFVLERQEALRLSIPPNPPITLKEAEALMAQQKGFSAIDHVRKLHEWELLVAGDYGERFLRGATPGVLVLIILSFFALRRRYRKRWLE